MRRSLLRAIAAPASSYTSTNSRTFITLSNTSKSSSCLSQLSRPQRSQVILSSLRRTYATEEEEKRENSLANSEQASDEAKDAVRDSNYSAENMTEAAKGAMESTTDALKSGVAGLGEAMQNAAGAGRGGPMGSSAQSSPIRHEGTRVPAQEGESSANLYLGNLYFEVTEDTLRQHFDRFGAIKTAKVVKDGRGLSKGFGYVEFMTQNDAQAARDALDGQVLEGRRLVIQYALPRKDGRVEGRGRGDRGEGRERRPRREDTGAVNAPSKTLFIGNLSYEMSDKDLNDLFREVKNVLDVRVAIDRRTGQPRGFAHADFTDVTSAEAAAEFLKEKEFYGRQLRIDYAASSGGKQ